MRKVWGAVRVAVACIAFSATSFAGGPFGIIHVGKWQGAAYTTDKGAFSHCTAAATFDDGRALVLAQNADRTWIIGIGDRSTIGREGDSLSLTLTFDNQAKFDIRATVGPHKILGGVLPAQAMDAFRKARQLVAATGKQTVQFDLAAAGNVVPSIEYCVQKINTNGIASAGDFSNPKGQASTAKVSAKPDDEPAR